MQRSYRIMRLLKLEETLVGLQSNLLLKAQSTQNIQIRFFRALSTSAWKPQKLKSAQPFWISVLKLKYPLNEFLFRGVQADPPQFHFEHYLCPATVDPSSLSVVSCFVLKCFEIVPRLGSKDIKTGLLQGPRAGIRQDKVQWEHSSKQLQWKQREWAWELGLTDKFCNFCVPETLGYTCTLNHIYRQIVWVQCLILGNEKQWKLWI